LYNVEIQDGGTVSFWLTVMFVMLMELWTWAGEV